MGHTPQRSIASVGSPAHGAVSLGFDGGRAEVATIALPAALARGQKFTMFGLSDWLDTAGKLSSAQLVSLAAAGMEIGCHGKTNTDMTTLNSTTRADEWDTARSALEALVGAGTVNHWSYPQGGINNTTTQAEGYLRYRTQRGFDANFIGSGLMSMKFRGITTFMRALTWQSSTHAKVLDYIRYAAHTPVVVTLRAETISDGAAGPTPTQLAEALDLAALLGVPFLTTDEAFGDPIWHPDPGFEDGGVGWFLAGGGTFTIATDTPDAGLNGTKSGLLDRTGGSGAPFLKARTPIHCFGETHTLSFRYRIVDRGGTGNIIATGRSIDFSEQSQGQTQSAALTATSWTLATVDFTAHALARALEVEFTIAATKDAALYIDHVHVGPKSLGVFG